MCVAVQQEFGLLWLLMSGFITARVTLAQHSKAPQFPHERKTPGLEYSNLISASRHCANSEEC